MSEVLNNMKTRRSIRKFKDEMIPDDVIAEIVEAGTYAPTGMGKQSPIILAVTNREMRDRLSAANAKVMGNEGMDPFYGAPVVLVVLADKSIPTHVYDGALVIGNMLNAAHDLGVGSCWIHRAKEEFEEPEWKQVLDDLGVTGDYEGIGHVILGYADGEEPEAKPRKDNWVYYIK